MFIERLVIENFRNYSRQDVVFKQGLNLLIGENGAGKTNLLEAIYFLGTLRSFKAKKKEELIRWEGEICTIRGNAQVSESDRELELSVSFNNHERRLHLNRKEVKRSTDYLGRIYVTLFAPESLMLVKGPPLERRSFLDRGIFHLDRKYLQTIHQYNKTLKQKISLLKSPSPVNGEVLQIWNAKMADLGSHMIEARLRYIEAINQAGREIGGMFFQGEQSVMVKYVSSLWRGNEVPQRLIEEEGSRREEVIRENFLKKLEEIKREEVRRRVPLIGPHRDDAMIYVGDKNVGIFGSQGEQRLASFLMICAEVEHFEKVKAFRPIILLDDIDSELDAKRREMISRFLFDKSNQIFLTSVEEPRVKGFGKGYQRYYITSGTITQ